jgi:hypothetical protein
MSAMKTFSLAAFAALSLGVGSAMAQNDGTSAPDSYLTAPHLTRQATPTNQVQSGSSDVSSTTTRFGANRAPATAYDYGDLANPG